MSEDPHESESAATHYPNSFVISVILGVLSLEMSVLLLVRRQMGLETPLWA